MRMTKIVGSRVRKVIVHMPRLSDTAIEIDAYKVSERFCSFGSTWNNKKGETNFVSHSDNTERYITVDITSALINGKSKQLIATNGLIFKPQKENNSFIAMTTGDSCFLPQIVEVNYDQY